MAEENPATTTVRGLLARWRAAAAASSVEGPGPFAEEPEEEFEVEEAFEDAEKTYEWLPYGVEWYELAHLAGEPLVAVEAELDRGLNLTEMFDHLPVDLIRRAQEKAGVELVVCAGKACSTDRRTRKIFFLYVVDPEASYGVWRRAVLALGQHHQATFSLTPNACRVRQSGLASSVRVDVARWMPPTRSAALAAQPGCFQVATCFAAGGAETVATSLARFAWRWGVAVLSPGLVDRAWTARDMLEYAAQLAFSGFLVLIPGLDAPAFDAELVDEGCAANWSPELRYIYTHHSNPRGPAPLPADLSLAALDRRSLAPTAARLPVPPEDALSWTRVMTRPRFIRLAARLAAAPALQWDRLEREAREEQEAETGELVGGDAARQIADFAAVPVWGGERPRPAAEAPAWVARCFAGLCEEPCLPDAFVFAD